MTQLPQPRPGILDIAPYIGGEAKAPGSTRQIRLASNEGALGTAPSVAAALREYARDPHRYPDGSALALRQALAKLHGLDADRIVCGAGSDELLQMLAKAYAGPGDEVISSQHGFLIYPIAAKAAGATPVEVPAAKDLGADLDAIARRVTAKTRLVFLANPNNPTGTMFGQADLEQLLARLPSNVLLVLDNAYAEYVDRADYPNGFDLVDRFPNLVVTRTFSKIYALAGLRLGWCYAPAAVADVLNRVRGPFNISQAAIACGVAAVEDQEFIRRSIAHNKEWRTWTASEFGKLGLAVMPSQGNFVLVDFRSAGAERVRQALKSRGILVRQMNAYGLPDYLRITIGTGEEMREVVEALRDILRQAA
jgi:histidinol-phosphate aminotransferase